MVAVYSTPFQLYAGDDWSQAFRMTVQPDPEVDATEPEDLSAYTGWAAQWRSTADATTPTELTVDATDADTGLIVVRATGAQVRAMGRAGVFDIQAELGGETRTFIRAKTSWKQDVTRD